MENEELAKQLMLAFSKMQKFHAKQHGKAHTKKSEMAIVSILKSHGKDTGLKSTQISKILHLPPSAITPVINTLEEKGLVIRSSSPEDRRIVMVQLTEKGYEFFEKKHVFFLQKSVDLCSYLGENDSLELIRIINKMSVFLTDEFEMECDKNTKPKIDR